jgi:hypothetical protein
MRAAVLYFVPVCECSPTLNWQPGQPAAPLVDPERLGRTLPRPDARGGRPRTTVDLRPPARPRRALDVTADTGAVEATHVTVASPHASVSADTVRTPPPAPARRSLFEIDFDLDALLADAADEDHDHTRGDDAEATHPLAADAEATQAGAEDAEANHLAEDGEDTHERTPPDPAEATTDPRAAAEAREPGTQPLPRPVRDPRAPTPSPPAPAQSPRPAARRAGLHGVRRPEAPSRRARTDTPPPVPASSHAPAPARFDEAEDTGPVVRGRATLDWKLRHGPSVLLLLLLISLSAVAGAYAARQARPHVTASFDGTIAAPAAPAAPAVNGAATD